jgi:hypothetical protein
VDGADSPDARGSGSLAGIRWVRLLQLFLLPISHLLFTGPDGFWGKSLRAAAGRETSWGLGLYRATLGFAGTRAGGRDPLVSVPRSRGEHLATASELGVGQRAVARACVHHSGGERQGKEEKVRVWLTSGPTWQ